MKHLVGFHLVGFLLQYLNVKPAYSETILSERNCLAKHASGKKSLVEVGVFQGVTTCALRKAMDPKGTLYGIDPFYRNRLGICYHQIIAERDINLLNNGNIKYLKMTSKEALLSKEWGPNPCLDFVFIDGDHSWEGIETDWLGFSPLICKGGIIALHDSRIRGEGCGSERYTNEVVLKDNRFKVIETEHSLTVLQRL